MIKFNNATTVVIKTHDIVVLAVSLCIPCDVSCSLTVPRTDTYTQPNHVNTKGKKMMSELRTTKRVVSSGWPYQIETYQKTRYGDNSYSLFSLIVSQSFSLYLSNRLENEMPMNIAQLRSEMSAKWFWLRVQKNKIWTQRGSWLEKFTV
jgi:hypothetical protein